MWACCAVSNHNLRHGQQVWSVNSFQFHIVGSVIDTPVAVEAEAESDEYEDEDFGYLPRYYVNGSDRSTYTFIYV